MGKDLSRLPHRLDQDRRTCCAVIETPKGRRSKYDYDPKARTFRLKKLLPEGQSFPLDFGFIPSTLCDDGDPLDVMVLMDEAGVVGGILDVRVLGVLEIEEVENGRAERNDRIVAAAIETHLYGRVENLDDLEAGFLKNLEAFWQFKGRLEGKQVSLIGVGKPKKAMNLIAKAISQASRGR